MVNKTEKIAHPAHYNMGRIEVKDFVRDQQLSFGLGNSVKYICRARYKGKELEDLKKALFYLQDEIKHLESLERPPS